MVKDRIAFEGCPINAGFCQSSILGSSLFLLRINDLIMLSVILLALLMILLSTLYLIGPQICGNSLSEFLTLNLILKALRIGCLKVEIIVIL